MSRVRSASSLIAIYLTILSRYQGPPASKHGILKRFNKFYVEFMIDGQLKHKKVLQKEILQLRDRQFLLVMLYVLHTLQCAIIVVVMRLAFPCWSVRSMPSTKIAATILLGNKEAIESLLAEGGLYILFLIILADEHLLTVSLASCAK